jgi:outer membrane protein OmpA-like peptidoglycan-associated protein
MLPRLFASPGIQVSILLALGAPLTGCRFSASASGDVKSSGDANADAQASLEKQEAPPPKPKAPSAPIQFREGRLDYEGVINFEYNKDNLRKDDDTQKTLADFKKFLDEHPTVKIEVEGHTDSRGSDEYNRDLSDRRAASVRKWLVASGIPEDRVTSVGKGEDQPQVPEPAECDDKVPADSTPCEGPWGKNRRVVFQVTKGAETLPKEPEPEPEPTPVVEAPPPAPLAKQECPWLWGGRVNAIGPNSWVMLEGATQPGICWLELSLGVGLGFNNADAENSEGGSADGRYVSFTVPVRGRFWFMDRHSVIGDLGVGFTHYRISADLDDGGGNSGSYTRRTTPLIGHLGVGYGFRPNGSQAGPRLALVVGGLLHFTDLGDSSADTDAGFANAAALEAAMDDETDDLSDLEPYGEVSFGWLF